MEELEYQSGNTLEIPLRSGDEVIELDADQLPECEEVLNILSQETAPLTAWINVALAYYKKRAFDDFEKVLEEARINVKDLQPYSEAHLVRLLDMLANYCGRKASKEKDRDIRNQLIARATTLYTSTDGIALYDQKHLLGRAFHFIYEGENWSQADSQLNFVLNQGAPCVPAFLGKACIAFNKKDYRNALGFYRRALKLQPNCPASVRLGIGHCYFKLGNLAKARLALDRALALDPNCVGALVGLAVLDLNEKTQDTIKQGVHKLSLAYNLDPTNPMVLNHLADHFFYKKEYDKVQKLAFHAFYNTENETMRAESCYQIARAYHVEEHYDKAFQYYYQATRFASPNFMLPFYGLGQMYLHKNDLEHAAQSFEKVLKSFPTNYETLKILGRLYGQSNNPEKLKQARELFKKVTEIQPDDVEAWIEYAQLLNNDVNAALDAYLKALQTLEDISLDISPEIFNNIGALYFMKKEYEQAYKFFLRSLRRIHDEERENNQSESMDIKATILSDGADDFVGKLSSTADDYFHGLSVTVNYNLARLFETTGETNKAENIYREIILKHPTYVDCHLRFGCIARNRGLIRDASVWFNDALEIKIDNPDARSLIGLLHFDKHEIEQAQKKFESLVRQQDYRADAFARIALGNIWLNSLHHSTRDKDRRKRHQERALSCYKAVLSADPRNIWAAHGIGCVLAHKGHVNEARDVFAQVRESTANFADVWVNIAHIYVEQKQYTAAIQMYDNCIHKFDRNTDTELLLYLARAHYKAGQLKECKEVLIKARMMKPWDDLLTYNLALVQKRLAVSMLQDESSSFSAVYESIADLNMARCSFDHLSKITQLPCRQMAQDETNTCQDLLKQAKYHLNRAKSREEQERVVKQRQEFEREAQKRRQQELQEKMEQMKKDREKRLEEERGKILEKAQQIVIEPVSEPSRSKKGGGGGGGGRSRKSDAFINDGDAYDSGGDERYAEASGDEAAASARRGKKRDRNPRERKQPANKKPRDHGGLTSKQRLRVVSKEVVSSSADNSSGDSSDAESDGQPKRVIFSSEEEGAGGHAQARSNQGQQNWDEGGLSSDLSSVADEDGGKRSKKRSKNKEKSAKKQSHKSGSGRKRRHNRVADDSSSDEEVKKPRKPRKKFISDDEESSGEQNAESDASGGARERARLLDSDEDVPTYSPRFPNTYAENAAAASSSDDAQPQAMRHKSFAQGSGSDSSELSDDAQMTKDARLRRLQTLLSDDEVEEVKQTNQSDD